MSDYRLTIKQRRFADDYILLGNATDAAIKAGYSPKGASTTGNKLLNHPRVRAYIDQRLKELESEKIAGQDEILQYLTSVMRGETSDQVLCNTGYGEQSLVEARVSEKDRLKAAELLGKRYGMFTDKLNLESTEGIKIIDNIS